MSDVDFSRLRSLTARQLVNALLRDGFLLIRQTGSHARFAHPDGRRVTVPYSRPRETFALATLRSIIVVQARWSEGDLIRLRLL